MIFGYRFVKDCDMMKFWEKVNKFNEVIEKIIDWFDESPSHLWLSYDGAMREKIKTALKRYAIYDEVNMIDEGFNGFGLVKVEFIGKEAELEDFKILIGKLIYDYLFFRFLEYARVRMDAQKISENIYVILVYYSFSRKTLKNFESHFAEISCHRKKETLDGKIIIDDELEEEMKKWKV